MDLPTALRDYTLAGNELWRIAALFGSVFVAMLLGKILQVGFRRTAERLVASRDSLVRAATLRALAAPIIFFLSTLGLKQGVKFLHMHPRVEELATSTTSVLVALAIGWLFYSLVDVVDVLMGKRAAKTVSKMDDMLVPIVRKSLRVTVVILTLVQVAQLLSDKPITSIIAGLGVGGLAVALAAQDTLKNFFGSLVILGDKPFELGDRIVIDGHDGSVEEVGFRSTKVRTLDGHVVTVPNGELANKTILNISKRPNIKRVLNLGVTYDTPPEKIERAVEIVKELLHDHEGVDAESPPRVYFSSFEDSSLNILAIYWYHPANYWEYMSFSERLNLEILRRFNSEGISMAFPTQTVHVEGMGKS